MSDWQPIELAPRDGRRIIAYFPIPSNWRDDWSSGAAETWWEGDRWAHPLGTPPTHWMPLPDPPEADS